MKRHVYNVIIQKNIDYKNCESSPLLFSKELLSLWEFFVAFIILDLSINHFIVDCDIFIQSTYQSALS